MLQLAIHQGVLGALRLAHDRRLKFDLLEDAELRAVGQARLPPQQRREVPKGAALGRQDVPHELHTVGGACQPRSESVSSPTARAPSAANTSWGRVQSKAGLLDQ